jgi:uncharacterized protein (DUF885 family)
MSSTPSGPDVAALADEYFAFHRRTAQLWNIDRGDVDEIEHWEELGAAAVGSRIEELDRFAARADDFGRAAGGTDHTMMAAVAFSARSTAAIVPYLRDVTLVAGSMNAMAFMTVMVPAYALTTADHGRGYVAKLRGVPAFVDGWIDGLRDGAAAGRCATARGTARAIREIDGLLATRLDDDPLLGQTPPSELSDGEAASWRHDVADAVRREVRPALARVRAVLHDEVLTHARPDGRAGICHAPDGLDDYQALLHAATSTALTPDEIHRIGLDQLARLDDEYRVLGAEALGVDDPATVRGRLRDDPAMRYRSADELLRDATRALQRATAEAPRWFSPVPAASCEAVPATAGPMAFYTGPSPDGARGGTCYFNVSAPELWTTFSLEPCVFHESIPGHHLQLALAQERGLHPVLGELEVTSFGEGWGLYAERLADEMSLYSGPLQRLGMLTLDSLRAARLVVDTGLHAMGWTRDEAIEVLLGATSLVRGNVEGEVDRYIADPGQATSYMIGRLELQRLRRAAETRLGPRFEPAAFHDIVLGSGMTPLPALERTVDAWIASVRPADPLSGDRWRDPLPG